MIGYLEGVLQYKDERTMIVSVGGVGYMLASTAQLVARTTIGETLALWTHLAVKEDALDLYGFLDRSELQLFRLLIGISGIGPKSALNVLSLADMNTIVHAIESGDAGYLTKVSGVGKKLAEKIVLELREKIGTLHVSTRIPHAETEALEALEALGYLPKDTREVVRALAKEFTTPEDIIRRALQIFGGADGHA